LPAVWQRPRLGDYQITFDLPPNAQQHDIDVLLRSHRNASFHHRSFLTGIDGLELAVTGADIPAC
jgi:hypothetical protein